MRPRRSRRWFLAAVGAAGTLGIAGCLDRLPGAEEEPTPADPDPVDTPYDLSVDHDVEAWPHYDPDWEPPTDSPLDAEYAVETVIENFEVPWDLAFGENGELFVSERIGRITRYDAGELEAVAEPADVIDHASSVAPDAEGADWWGGGSEGGLLGLTLHPNYPDVPVCYAFYTYEARPPDPDDDDDDGLYENRLVLYDLADGNAETVVIDEIPGHRIVHNGSRIAFGPRNYLWVTTGDANEEALAADLSSLAGKLLRLEPDGTAPEDAPEWEDPAWDDPRIHSIGHRNAQGIAWLPDGTTLLTEHGPQARDELQVAAAGEDHGWPDVRGGPDDDSYGRYGDHDDVVTPPLVNTGPGETWAPSGGVFYTGGEVPALRNRLLVGGLISERLYAVSIFPGGEAPDIGGERYDADWLHPDWDAVVHELLVGELGRIRHVAQAPDGTLYAITSNRDGRSEDFPVEGDDRLVRIVQNG